MFLFSTFLRLKTLLKLFLFFQIYIFKETLILRNILIEIRYSTNWNFCKCWRYMSCLFQMLFWLFVIIEHTLGLFSRFVLNLLAVAEARIVLKIFLFWAKTLYLLNCSCTKSVYRCSDIDEYSKIRVELTN